MVGIPFKRMDKKVEKSLLSSRKKLLIYQLEQSNSTNDILELSTMLLGAQTRNYFLCGKTLTSYILDLLLEDKKVNFDLRKLFQDVLDVQRKKTDHDEDNLESENEIALKLKLCALSKNMLLYMK